MSRHLTASDQGRNVNCYQEENEASSGFVSQRKFSSVVQIVDHECTTCAKAMNHNKYDKGRLSFISKVPWQPIPNSRLWQQSNWNSSWQEVKAVCHQSGQITSPEKRKSKYPFSRNTLVTWALPPSKLWGRREIKPGPQQEICQLTNHLTLYS